MEIGKIGKEKIDISFWKVTGMYIGIMTITYILIIVGIVLLEVMLLYWL
jgi:hypothetical protein